MSGSVRIWCVRSWTRILVSVRRPSVSGLACASANVWFALGDRMLTRALYRANAVVRRTAV